MFDTLFRGVTEAAQDNKWYGMYARHVNNGHNQNFFQEIMDACAPTPRSKAHDAPAATASPREHTRRFGTMSSLHAAAEPSRVRVAQHQALSWRPKVIVTRHINWDDVDYIITNIQKCSQPELREYRDIIDSLIDLYDDYGHPNTTDDLTALGSKRNQIAYNLYERSGKPKHSRPELGMRLIKAGYDQAPDSPNGRIRVYHPLLSTERLYVDFMGNVPLTTQLRDIKNYRQTPAPAVVVMQPAPRSTVHQQASFYLLFKGGNVPAS
jgi:hypothetical protein